MIPQPGYYRNLLSDKNVRIAFTHTPMYGVTRIDNTRVLEELKQSSDEYAQYYINGLQNGEMVTIVENSYSDKYFAPGELYFKS
jgi:hypothetical protein